jgi:hypothetical protein
MMMGWYLGFDCVIHKTNIIFVHIYFNFMRACGLIDMRVYLIIVSVVRIWTRQLMIPS